MDAVTPESPVPPPPVPDAPAPAPPPPPEPPPAASGRRLTHAEKIARAVAAGEAAERAAASPEPAAPPAEDPHPVTTSAPGAEAPPAPAEEPLPDARDLRKEKMRLYRKERELRAQERASSQERQRLQQFEQARSAGDPDAGLRALGYDPRAYQERLIVRALKDGPQAPPDPVDEKINGEVGPLRQEIQRLRAEAQQLAQRQDVERYVTHEILPVVVDGEKFEALHAWHEGPDGKADLRKIGWKVAEVRAQYFQAHGEWLPIAEVAEALDWKYDKAMVAGLERVAKTKRHAARFTAAPAAPPARPAARPAASAAPARTAAPPAPTRLPTTEERRRAFVARWKSKEKAG